MTATIITPETLEDLVVTLLRCQGYTELHMWREAWAELETIPRDLQFTRPVLLTTMELLIDAKSWENATWLGLSLMDRWPGDSRARLLTACCLQHVNLNLNQLASLPISQSRRSQ